MDGFDIEQFRTQLIQTDPLVRDIWHDKYRLKHADGSSDEDSVPATRRRVVDAVYANDPNKDARREAELLVQSGVFIPAGRINAGAGSGRQVTLINCYVMPTVMDSLPGIQLVIAQGALTMQQGGGIGIDWSPVRPRGALVRRTGSTASGVIPYADQTSAMCDTIMSAGTRRGAMMATLRDDHPDLWNPQQFITAPHPATGDPILTYPSFISAKRQKGRLTGFNVSVLVSDAFLKAIEDDADWDLGFHVPPADGRHIDVYEKMWPYDYAEIDNAFNELPEGRVAKGTVMPWYVYRRVKARVIWEDMMRSTYKYAEPGVIYIDRINERNNLYYCEDIRCTNPCGEQPLPPNNVCCLGSINLAFLVNDPFSSRPWFDFAKFGHAVNHAVRFLDNVLDISNYPLEAQRLEAQTKRRIGLGITGWGDCLVQLGLRYDSDEAVQMARALAKALQHASYYASMGLAKERGPFPAYGRKQFLAGYNARRLPEDLHDQIHEYGIRNGVLNTIAPNGTISIYSGNVSSGHEPIFSFAKVERNVRQPDGSGKKYMSVPYSYRLYEAMFGETPREKLPEYFVGAMDITPEAHVRMHAAWQEHIDASVSKTINCPTEMSYDDFKDVYRLAYELGAKGCTTFRPDPDSGRGSVLSELVDTAKPVVVPNTNLVPVEVMPAQRVVEGRRYKLKWPKTGENWYINVTRIGNVPFEVFISTGSADSVEWVQALSRLLTAVLRRGGDVKFLLNELFAVHSSSGGGFIAEQHKFRPSIVAAIGGVLEEEFRTLGLLGVASASTVEKPEVLVVPVTVTRGAGIDSCPECGATPLVREQGCLRCLRCDFTKCG